MKIQKVIDGVAMWVEVDDATGAETVLEPVAEADLEDELKAELEKGKKQEPDTSLEAAITERLKPIKSKLDTVYTERDKLKADLLESQKKLREIELKNLRDSGKEKEALTLELEETRRENEQLKAANTTLARDNALRDALSGLNFRSERASTVAFKELSSDFTRNQDGQWVNSTGQDIKAAVQAFQANEDNAFLFKAKENRGGGSSSQGKGGEPQPKTKPLRELSTTELLDRAQKGTLRS